MFTFSLIAVTASLLGAGIVAVFVAAYQVYFTELESIGE